VGGPVFGGAGGAFGSGGGVEAEGGPGEPGFVGEEAAFGVKPGTSMMANPHSGQALASGSKMGRWQLRQSRARGLTGGWVCFGRRRRPGSAGFGAWAGGDDLRGAEAGTSEEPRV